MQLVIPKGVNVLDYLKDKGVFIPTYCGGSGVCGKCLVRVVAGSLDITVNDRFVLSADELDKGYRLACKAYTSSPVRIELPEQTLCFQTSEDMQDTADSTHTFGIALDIGTTTLAVSLVDITDKRPVRTVTLANSQALFGADVITRLSAASEHSHRLYDLICNDISSLIGKLDCTGLDVIKMAIAGNTAMYHLLLRLDCTGLVKAPFSPMTTGGETLPLSQLLGRHFKTTGLNDISVYLIKGISAFVGGDITSGLASLTDIKPPYLFADIGTNGEIAAVTDKRVLCSSTAAGPALEGGELSCGMGGVDGAVSRIFMRDDKLHFDMIGTPPAKGLCGSAAVDALSVMSRCGIIDATGAFTDADRQRFEITDNVFVTQDDVRKLQLAKSAIRSGLDITLARAGLGYSDVSTLVIAGGFGYYLDLDSAAGIGLIPSELLKSAKALGNTSLRGAQRSLYDDEFFNRLEWIIQNAALIALHDDTDFKNSFISNIDLHTEEV